jgi:hypothetical protein
MRDSEAVSSLRDASRTIAANQAADASHEVTRKLARFILASHFENLPALVRREAARTLLNWIGCAVGGSHHQAVTNAMAALAPFFGPGQATLLGRSERVDVLHAALLNGISSHVLDSTIPISRPPSIRPPRWRRRSWPWPSTVR